MRAAWCYVKPGPATRWRCQVPETLDSDGENETNVVAHTYTHTHTYTHAAKNVERNFFMAVEWSLDVLAIAGAGLDKL